MKFEDYLARFIAASQNGQSYCHFGVRDNFPILFESVPDYQGVFRRETGLEVDRVFEFDTSIIGRREFSFRVCPNVGTFTVPRTIDKAYTCAGFFKGVGLNNISEGVRKHIALQESYPNLAYLSFAGDFKQEEERPGIAAVLLRVLPAIPKFAIRACLPKALPVCSFDLKDVPYFGEQPRRVERK